MNGYRTGEYLGPEQRRFRRVVLGTSIECRCDFEVIQARAENISISGLLVRTPSPFAEDSTLQIVFSLPGIAAGIHGEARVAHVVPGVFMGLEFTSLPAPALEAIERYIASVPLPPPKKQPPQVA